MVRSPTKKPRVLRVRADVDVRGKELTPTMMFVYGRADGVRSIKQLSEITRLPEDETREVVQALAAQGMVDVPDGFDEADLDRATRDKIDEFHGKLRDMDFYQLLQVGPGADAKAIRRSYFKVSKEFHPDRYYGKRLGPYKTRLEEIFVRVSQAHDFLSDSKRRAAYEERLRKDLELTEGAPEGWDAAKDAPAEPKAEPGAQAADTSGVTAEMRARTRRAGAKARKFFEEGLRELKANDYTAAALALRRAAALEPHNPEYQARYKAALQRAGESSAEEYVKLAEDEEKAGRLDAAAALFERAAWAGGQAEPHAAAAQFFLRIGRLIEAKEHAMRAAHLDSGCAAWHLVLSRVYAAAGFAKQARREADIALHLDPASPAKELLKDIEAQ